VEMLTTADDSGRGSGWLAFVFRKFASLTGPGVPSAGGYNSVTRAKVSNDAEMMTTDSIPNPPNHRQRIFWFLDYGDNTA
jgi:hypothetical protein